MRRRVVSFFFMLLIIFTVSSCANLNTVSEEPETHASDMDAPAAPSVKPEEEAPPEKETLPEKMPEKGKIGANEEKKSSPAPKNTAPAEAVSPTDEKKNICSLSVVCNTALKSNKLSDSLRESLPESGVILNEQNVAFTPGDSAFDILRKITREKNIHFEFSKTPMYDSCYIEGIANLYEFDCGDLSGWLFSVNGEFQSVASSEIKINNGDKIEFVYTCDLGRDVGAYIGG